MNNMKKILFLMMGLALSVAVMANENKQGTACKNAPKNNLTEMVIAHITEHGILTKQELADFTAIYCQLNESKRALNKENRAIKKQLETCTDSNKMVELMQKIANNDLKRAQLDKEALDAYIEKIDASRLVQVLQCSEKYKNELFKNMRLKRAEKYPKAEK
jgi:hypothetical protein